MRRKSVFAVSRPAARLSLVALVFLPALAGCMGKPGAEISMTPGAADAKLQSLIRDAAAGDKEAQFLLGVRYETGDGVAVDRKKARWLYARAGSDEGGTVWVYSPSSSGSGGTVIPINKGMTQPGLMEARRRLAQMDVPEPKGRSTRKSLNARMGRLLPADREFVFPFPPPIVAEATLRTMAEGDEMTLAAIRSRIPESSRIWHEGKWISTLIVEQKMSCTLQNTLYPKELYQKFCKPGKTSFLNYFIVGDPGISYGNDKSFKYLKEYKNIIDNNKINRNNLLDNSNKFKLNSNDVTISFSNSNNSHFPYLGNMILFDKDEKSSIFIEYYDMHKSDKFISHMNLFVEG